jgi:tripartite-type tricarboxylate transporter receptor subunit TctC
MSANRRLFFHAGAALASSAVIRVQAQDTSYPTRPVRMVVGFPAGQSLDIGARAIAPRLTTELGQSVIIDNKPGATGIIAHEFVKAAAPDGYTLLMASGATLAINPGLYRKLPYDAIKDYTPIVLVNSSPMYLVTSPSVPVQNVREMLAYVRARPGQLAYASGGSGLTQHIAMEMLKKDAGLDILHVPYKGSPAAVTDLIAGRVQFAFDSAPSILPHADAGRVRLLGISSSTRSNRRPEVMTIAEQGVPGFQALTWAAILGPAGMPANLVERLNGALNRVLNTREMQDYYGNIGSAVAGGSPSTLSEFHRSEIVRWGAAIKASGAQVD